jgi:hypothetical protein
VGPPPDREWIKKNAAQGILPEHCFLESKTGIGVDLMVHTQQKWDLIEIKAIKTVTETSLRQIQKTATMLGSRVGNQALVAPVLDKQNLKGIRILPWQEI